jgi:hypothetical protein
MPWTPRQSRLPVLITRSRMFVEGRRRCRHHVKPAERTPAVINVRSRPVPSCGPGSATGPSSKLGRDSIRSVRHFHKPRRQQRRQQQPRRLPPRRDVRLRHDKHRRDTRLRDERQRGQRRRAHRDMRRHHLKSWQCTRYRRKRTQPTRRSFDVTCLLSLSLHDCQKAYSPVAGLDDFGTSRAGGAATWLQASCLASLLR